MPATTARQKRRQQRSRIFLLGGLLVFFALLFGAGWLFLVQDTQTTDIRSEAASDRSYQMLIESSETRAGRQRFDVYVSAQSTDAVVTAFETEIALLPAGAIAPSTPLPSPAVPEAGGPRQSLRQLLQKLSLVSLALAQSPSPKTTPAPTLVPQVVVPPVSVASPIASRISFSSSITRVDAPPGSWKVKLTGRVRADNGRTIFQGKVKVAEIVIDTAAAGRTSFLARFVNQSIKGYLVVAPGAEVELTRLDPRGFSCPAVVSERCPRGYRLGTEATSGCVQCLRQRSPIDIIRRQPAPVPEFTCIQLYQPVCGADGKTYGNECEAARAGIKVAKAGACP